MPFNYFYIYVPNNIEEYIKATWKNDQRDEIKTDSLDEMENVVIGHNMFVIKKIFN